MSRNIIAILRGVKPNEVLEIARTIAENGITQIEVPMNSPDVFDSIQLLHAARNAGFDIRPCTMVTSGMMTS